MSQSRSELIGNLAAVLTWSAVGGAAAAGVGIQAGPLWWVAYVGYAAVLLPLCRSVDHSRPVLVTLLAALALLGLTVFVLSPFGPSGAALVVTACLLATWLPDRVALTVMAAQTLLAALAGILLQPRPDSAAVLIICVVYFGFQLFAFLMVIASRREAAARQTAEQAQAALYRAQTQLAERSRDEERLRISRDLHDTLGHQLTALAVNLEVLAHTVDGAAAEQARTCRDLARDTLIEVREVVGKLRDHRPVDLRARLTCLLPEMARPRLDLHIDPQVDRMDAVGVDAVARLVQEALTNSARHSRSTVLTVRVWRTEGGFCVEAHDDGCGNDTIVAGNGLRGMAERFAALGGAITWTGTEGFTIRAHLPQAASVGAR